MSVSDPLIKEIKGYAQKLLEKKRPLTDEDVEVASLCECLERVLYQGLLPSRNTLGFPKSPHPWFWLQEVANEKLGASYSFVLCVNNVRKCAKIRTQRGRTRLLLRAALVKRCLHIPFQLLLESSRWLMYYNCSSVLGDEILQEVLMSALLVCKRLEFKLELNNARFLDDTWVIPQARNLQLVPCSELGISVIFVTDKAVIVEVSPFSVASENANIEVGDILDDLNGLVISDNMQGSLINVMRRATHQPVYVNIVKAEFEGNLFPPIVPLLSQAGLDPALIISNKNKQRDEIDSRKPEETVIKYVGNVKSVGGGIKDIHKCINELLASPDDMKDTAVIFECQDIGVKVTDKSDDSTIVSHPFVEITSCGYVTTTASYFGFISKSLMSTNSPLICHVFHCSEYPVIEKILKSISQGFKMTQCTA